MTERVIAFGEQGRQAASDGRLDSAAFHRNQAPIRNVLLRHLAGQSGDVLEAGSGSGQHIIEFARDHPAITWWPSDLEQRHLVSIAAWRAQAGLDNVRPPQRIDLADPAWRIEPQQGRAPGPLLAMVCANVVHIAPWRVAEGLFAGAGRHLRSGGWLFLYGPFKRDGGHTAPSNAAFDARLRQTDPDWGVRDIADLQRLGTEAGVSLREIAEMPANNLMLAFARA